MTPPKPLIRATGRAHAVIYRISRGRLLTRVGRADILLLTTVGRRTGEARTVPLLYVEDGGSFVVVGSLGGHDTHPAWYLNLRAAPEAIVRIGGRTTEVVAEEADGEAGRRLWQRLVEAYPPYARYRERTSRAIPIVILRPRT